MSIASLYPSINPSLLLDFANSKVLDPRITFTRTTTATYYDSVTTAKAEENLLTYSQAFDNEAWSTTASTVTANSTTAPDGTSTADTLTETATTNYHSIYQINISLAATSYTFSCFAKPNGRNEITLVMLSGSDTAYATYNVSTGSITVAATTSGSFSSASTTITASANGFYRVTLTATAPSTSTATLAIELYNAARTYAGNGTSGVYLWGAQLEQRSSATAYTATTTQAITNYIPVLQTASAGQARFDHNPTTGESLGLLIEEARTNSVTYSSQFSNVAWTKSACSITSTANVAPDGTLTAQQLVEDTTANGRYIQSNSINVVSGNSYTSTFYVKANGRSIFFIYFNAAAFPTNSRIAWFDIANQTTQVQTGVTASITSVGNGWYRCSCTATANASTTTPCQLSIPSQTLGSLSNYTGNGFSGLFLWGAQLEAGSFATSYIPTVASSVTRNADAASMTGTNFSSWFNNGEGTLYGEMQRAQGAISGTNFHIVTVVNSSTGYDNYYKLRFEGSSTAKAALSYTSGTAQASFTQGTQTAGNFYKLCLGVKVNDFGFSSDNTTASTDTSGTVPLGLNQMIIGADVDGTSQIANNRIRKLAYYPIKATNAQLQALTV